PGGPALVIAGLVGAVLVWRAGQRTAAWLLVLSAALSIAGARAAAAWAGLSPEVPARLVTLAAAFLVPPASYGVWVGMRRARVAALGTLAVVAGLLVVAWADGHGRPIARALGVAGDP